MKSYYFFITFLFLQNIFALNHPRKIYLGDKWTFENFDKKYKILSNVGLASRGVLILENKVASSFHLFITQRKQSSANPATSQKLCDQFMADFNKAKLKGQIRKSILTVNQHSFCMLEKRVSKYQISNELFLTSDQTIAQVSVQYGNVDYDSKVFNESVLSHLRYLK